MTPGTASFSEIRGVAFISAIAWGIGTNWLGEWYYPFRGIGWGDIFFMGWFGTALLDRRRRLALALAFWEARSQTLLVFTFMTLLLISTTVNAYSCGAETADLLAILRLLYFSAIILFVHVFIRQHGYERVVFGFLVGVGLLTLGRLYDAHASNAVVVKGVLVLKDPNVIGNMLGIAVIFCSLGILAGYPMVSLTAALLFSIASVMTFSKGTWLMVSLGLLANTVAWLLVVGKARRGVGRFVAATAALLAGVAWLAYRNAHVLSDLLDYKLKSTYQSETADYRYRFALVALHAMTDYPVWGLGFRNYSEVERLYPTEMPEPSENAHNVFLHIGAVAGLPALAVLLALVAYPFFPFWCALRTRFAGWLVLLYVALTFTVFVLSGSVQLQLIAQPFFWVFTGIACGWYASLRPPSRCQRMHSSAAT